MTEILPTNEQLLRENYWLKSEIDDLKKLLQQSKSLNASRHQAIREVINHAFQIMNHWEMVKDSKQTDDFLRGEYFVIQGILNRFTLLSSHDPDVKEMLEKPIQQQKEFREWLIAHKDNPPKKKRGRSQK